MARIAIFAFAIGSLALASCRTPQQVPQSAPQATVPRDAPPPEQAAPAAPAAPVLAQTPAPQVPATTPKPSSPKTIPAAGKQAPPPVAAEPKAPSAPGAVPAPAPAPAAAKAAALDLNSLEQRLKDTRAIGVFTKLSLKNQVDDLLSEFRAYHKGSSKTPQSELRQKFDLLMLKVLSLLQDGDPQLASAIASSREVLWGILLDPQKFAKI
jgi:hypothetical protein